MRRISMISMIRIAVMVSAIFILCTVASFADRSDFEVNNISVSQTSVNWGQYVTVHMDYTAKGAVPHYIRFSFVNNDAVYSSIDDGYGGTYSLYKSSVGVNIDTINQDARDCGNMRYCSYDPATGEGSFTVDVPVDSRHIVGHYTLGQFVQSMHMYTEDNKYRDDFYDVDEWSDVGFDVHTYYGYESFDKDYLQEDLVESLEALQDGDIAVVRCREDIEVRIDKDTGEMLTYRNFGWVQLEKRMLDAIRGRNVILIVPDRAEINGADIVNDTRNVILGTDVGMAGLDNGEVQMHLRFNDSGQLPGKIRYYIGTVDRLNSMLSEGRNKTTIADIIEQGNIYYVNSGELVNDDAKTEIANGKLWVELTHNSSYVCSTLEASKLASFNYIVNKTAFTYNGKVQKPSLTVSKIKGTSYTVTYDNKSSKNVGEYRIVLKGTGDGYGKRTIRYVINPKGTSISKLYKGRKQMTVKWKKQTKQTTGYQIRYSLNKKFKTGVKTVTIKKPSTTQKVIKKLKSNKTYYVQIRTFKKTGTKQYSSNWSTTKKVK